MVKEQGQTESHTIASEEILHHLVVSFLGKKKFKLKDAYEPLTSVDGFALPRILVNGSDEYEEKRQISNTKFQFRPLAIILCQSTIHVQFAVLFANWLNKQIAMFQPKKDRVEIRVRSGGHDHEGECSGTDVLLIDLSGIKHLKIDEKEGALEVGPGALFKNLIDKMNHAHIGIPHGTCNTVGIGGYLLGGGWGPWTRLHGMGCESLIGATIVLGDGSVAHPSINPENDKDRERDLNLLWALRGGGGMSYGIVTNMKIRTFALPPQTWKITVKWDKTPALDVLRLWESWIAPDQNPTLLGTNLKIVAKPLDDQPVEKSVHHCEFYGYFAGSLDELKAQVKQWLDGQDELKDDLAAWLKGEKRKSIQEDDGEGPDPDAILDAFNAWDQPTNSQEVFDLYAVFTNNHENPDFLIRLETETPAPRKITSRIVREEGLGDEGRKSLIRSLESNLLSVDGANAGMNCYVTLGAISGSYYQDYDEATDGLGSAFPYKKRPYTIQYQAWWNVGKEGRHAGRVNHIDRYINAAEDWIAVCREREFPQTHGSFISFKDNAVPTRNYFLESFERLKKIKHDHSKDQNNIFSTRKTII